MDYRELQSETGNNTVISRPEYRISVTALLPGSVTLETVTPGVVTEDTTDCDVITNLAAEPITKPEAEVGGKPVQIGELVTRNLTVDEVVNEIMGTRPGFFHIVIVMIILSYGLSVDSLTYLTVFGGIIPYTKWDCVSDYCRELYENSTDQDNFYSEKVLCESGMKLGEDFLFDTTDHTSMAVDWGLFCEEELKMASLSSMIFAGAYVGFLGASVLFDRYGRKKVTIASGLLSFITVLASGFSPDYYTMFVLRFFMGLGKNVCWAGLFCWLLEFTPATMTVFISAVGYTSHSMGLLLVDCVAYSLIQWRHIFLVMSGVTLLSLLPLVFLPESPRFLITRGQAAEARAVLERVSRVIGRKESSLENVELSYKVHKQSTIKQIKDFVKYPKFGRQSLLLAPLWLGTCSLGYAFQFGWGKLSSNLYISYVLSSAASISAFHLMVPAEKLAGKKKGLLALLSGCVVFFCLAMIDHSISETWSIELIASLLGFLCTISANTMTYIYTSDVTPTSHRGMVMCICGSFGRIGSFLGPYLQLLFNLADRRVPFGIFVGIALLCITAVVFTDDPTGKPMPETPMDVRDDRKGPKMGNKVGDKQGP